MRARGSRSQQWYAESRAQMLRKKCRTQSLWNLHLAGDWHVGSETMPLGASSHMMRVMLISNLAVDQVTFFALRPPSLFYIRGDHMLSSGSPTVLRGACCSGTRPRTNRREGRCLHIVRICWRGSARRGGHGVRTRGVGAMGGRNSVGRPIDFPLFCRRRPHQCHPSRIQETSLSKGEMMPDIDHMDIGARQENLAVRGEPIMLQLCVVPAYVHREGL